MVVVVVHVVRERKSIHRVYLDYVYASRISSCLPVNTRLGRRGVVVLNEDVSMPVDGASERDRDTTPAYM